MTDAGHLIIILHQHIENTVIRNIPHISKVKCNVVENINILQAVGYIQKFPALCIKNNM